MGEKKPTYKSWITSEDFEYVKESLKIDGIFDPKNTPQQMIDKFFIRSIQLMSPKADGIGKWFKITPNDDGIKCKWKFPINPKFSGG